MTGLDCPGCGLTRCFISVGHGRLADATQFNPVGILLYVFVVVQIPFRLLQIFRIKNGWEELQWYEAGTWIVIGIAFLLLGQWVVRIVGSMLLGW